MTNNINTVKQLEDVYNSEQELVYGISHDMGAPLRSVVQFSQLLQNKLREQLDEKETFWLQLIQENGVKAQNMIDALLVYSRLSSQCNKDESFNLNSALQEAIAEHEDAISGATTQLDVPVQLPDFVGCRDHWVVLFSNLIANALLYQPRDEQHQVKLKITCAIDADVLSISIEDNGIGVPEEQWPRLTMPFKRMQAEEEYPGMGMGLACCNRIAIQHKGKLCFSKSSMGGLAVKYVGPLID